MEFLTCNALIDGLIINWMKKLLLTMKWTNNVDLKLKNNNYEITSQIRTISRSKFIISFFNRLIKRINPLPKSLFQKKKNRPFLSSFEILKIILAWCLILCQYYYRLSFHRLLLNQRQKEDFLNFLTFFYVVFFDNANPLFLDL